MFGFVRFVLLCKLLLMEKAEMVRHSMGGMGHCATTSMPRKGLKNATIGVDSLGCLAEGLEFCGSGQGKVDYVEGGD